MTATRITWGQAFWTVVVATIMTAVATLIHLVLLSLAGLPLPEVEDVSGRGWPWRIDGPWSLAADVGPLLLVGATFALFAEGHASRRTGVATRRLPIALTAALLGWVMIDRPTNAGVISVSGFVSFLALVVVTREMSGRARRPWRWTRPQVCAALVLAAALTLATLSYGLLHPVGAEQAESTSVNQMTFVLRNAGRADVHVLSVTAPSMRARALVAPVDGSYEYSPDDPDAGMVPIAGKTIESGWRDWVTLKRVGDCRASRTVDRLNVRLRVFGRTVDQVVRIAPVTVDCS